jgi:hypothetical protein
MLADQDNIVTERSLAASTPQVNKGTDYPQVITLQPDMGLGTKICSRVVSLRLPSSKPGRDLLHLPDQIKVSVPKTVDAREDPAAPLSALGVIMANHRHLPR